jgi:hypothetical protein
MLRVNAPIEGGELSVDLGDLLRRVAGPLQQLFESRHGYGARFEARRLLASLPLPSRRHSPVRFRVFAAY